MLALSILKKAAKTITMVMVAAAMSYGAVETFDPSIAEAGAKKKVQFVSKGIGKVGGFLEKAGRKAQAKRGIGKHVGGILKNTGKGFKKTSKGVNKGMGKVSRGTNKFLGKSKVGRGLKKGWRNVKQRQDQTINRAFGNCGGRFCKGAREGVRLFAPM
ncbi:hypothetical protein [Roseibium polysiphoniae]|uniref:Uncharacterized protein n=1 Tax=Roseibium polysiphoniae TaxID=2571221 RepID=A0ABR9CGW0_9HYPH|nr:hypothetical protein [Roseibium polysiphoniae]MBD8878257.1 hypothetical protein [Roseibium polysiphoniae]